MNELNDLTYDQQGPFKVHVEVFMVQYEPIILFVVAGSSCVALHPSHNVWCRGIVKGYADDSLRNVLVELVDLGSLQVIDRIDVRQLPCEYSNVRFLKRNRSPTVH